MIEDDLRSLLTERARDLPHNPARPAEVRSRIGTIRRRRVAGTALGLVLLAVAGLAVLRLPGANESLPPGVPAPPYFDGIHVAVPGYTTMFQTPEALDGPYERFLPSQPGDFRYLVATRCVRKGKLTLRNQVNGASLEVSCSRTVGDHFEGAAVFDAAAARTLLAQGSAVDNVRFEPGGAGQEAALLVSNDADRLRPWSDAGSSPPLADGTRTRAGTTVNITIPGYRGTRPDGTDGLALTVECVAGVRIAFSVPAGPLGTADCDPLARNRMEFSSVTVGVTRAKLDRLGLRTGQRVPLTIRSVGRNTDQWRVFPII